jgi:hypothetical protein
VTARGDGCAAGFGLALPCPSRRGAGLQLLDNLEGLQPMHINEILRQTLGPGSSASPGINGTIRFSAADGAEITLVQLQTLSRLLGTERVSISYSRETGPWSDITPGDPSSHEIRADGVAAEVEFDQMVYLPEKGFVTGRVVMRNGALSEA